MSATAAARFRRLAAVLPQLAGAEEVRIEELAPLAGIAPDELMRDLQALAERYDDPAGFVEGVAVLVDGETVSVRTDHFRRPMRLTAAELCALELGLSLLAHERVVSQNEVIDRLRQSQTALVVALPRDAAYAGLRDGALMDGAFGEVLPALRSAIRSSAVTTITYQGGAATDAQARAVHLYALIFSRGCWFMLGWCERSEGMRVFRTDRISSPAATGRTFERSANYRLDEFMVDGKPFSAATPPAQLTV